MLRKGEEALATVSTAGHEIYQREWLVSRGRIDWPSLSANRLNCVGDTLFVRSSTSEVGAGDGG